MMGFSHGRPDNLSPRQSLVEAAAGLREFADSMDEEARQKLATAEAHLKKARAAREQAARYDEAAARLPPDTPSSTGGNDGST